MTSTATLTATVLAHNGRCSMSGSSCSSTFNSSSRRRHMISRGLDAVRGEPDGHTPGATAMRHTPQRTPKRNSSPSSPLPTRSASGSESTVRRRNEPFGSLCRDIGDGGARVPPYLVASARPCRPRAKRGRQGAPWLPYRLMSRRATICGRARQPECRITRRSGPPGLPRWGCGWRPPDVPRRRRVPGGRHPQQGGADVLADDPQGSRGRRRVQTHLKLVGRELQSHRDDPGHLPLHAPHHDGLGAALLAAEVPPDGARRQAHGLRDLIAAGRVHTLRPEQTGRLP